MTALTLDQASTIVDKALEKGRELKLHPLTVVVLDAGGHLVAMKREDKSGILRTEIATGKAWGTLGMALAGGSSPAGRPPRRLSPGADGRLRRAGGAGAGWRPGPRCRRRHHRRGRGSAATPRNKDRGLRRLWDPQRRPYPVDTGDPG